MARYIVDEKMDSLKSKDKKYIWHPFTQMKWWEEEDNLVIERGEGVYLYDTDGNKYIDGVSSLWCNIHGHRVSQIDDAIKAQLGKIAHSTFLGLSNVPAILLAERIIGVAPKGLTRVFYSDSGSEAMEIALKMAYQYWQNLGEKKRQKFLTLTEAYHGDTVGSVSLGGIELFHNVYKPLLFETIKVSPDLASVENILKKSADELAAFVFEPLIQCAGGFIIQPEGFVKGVRELCDKYNVLMVLDEVATGFGRTGKMFACQHEDITPDIMALAKGLTGGYLPLAATLAKEKIFEAFLGKYSEKKTFYHGHTFTANQLGSAAALACLEIIEKDNVLAKLQPKIEFLHRELERFWGLEHVSDIRQVGFITAIELVQSKKHSVNYPFEARIGHKVILEARKLGAILRPLGDIIVLMPPLVISEKELKDLLDITYKSIYTATNG